MTNQIQWTAENLNDPVWFIEYFFKCKLWEKQRQVALSVRDNRVTAVRSCHDSGKSFDAARIALWFLQTNKDSKVITTAPSWTQVSEILWREIRSAYNTVKEVDPAFQFQGRLLGTKLDISPDWFAMGMATRKEGDATEVAERMLGFHSRTGKILVIVDEASGILEPIWGAIEGLMTSEGVKLLAIGNPYRISGSFAKLFKQKGVSKIWIQDTDIPNIKENKILIPGLMSPRYPKEMAEKYGKDSNIYLIKVKGQFPQSETDTLISLDLLEQAFEKTQKPEGVKKLGIDVARYGGDRTVFIVRQGKKILRKEIIYKSDLMTVVARGSIIMDEENIEAEEVSIDDIGSGGGVVDRFIEKRYKVNGVNVGSTADDEDHFYNIRAEAGWRMREWIKDADIPREDDYLEIANIKYKWRSDKKGQLQLEAKEDMKKRGLDSPDVFDALMLTFTETRPVPFPEQGPRVRKGMKFMDSEEEVEITEDSSGKPDTAGLYDKEF